MPRHDGEVATKLSAPLVVPQLGDACRFCGRPITCVGLYSCSTCAAAPHGPAQPREGTDANPCVPTGLAWNDTVRRTWVCKGRQREQDSARKEAEKHGA